MASVFLFSALCKTSSGLSLEFRLDTGIFLKYILKSVRVVEYTIMNILITAITVGSDHNHLVQS